MTEPTPAAPATTAKPKSSRLKNGCLIGLAVFVGLGVLGSIVGDPPKSGAGGSASSAPAAPDTAEVRVKASARELFSAYEANQLSAGQRFEGKPLEINGTISSIDESMGSPVLLLATSNQFMSVRAVFPKSAATVLATMAKGQKVTVLCDSLTEAGGFLSLHDCALKGVP